MVLLIRAQPVKIMRTETWVPRALVKCTFVEDRFQCKGLIVRESTGHIIGFCVADHEAEVCFEGKSFFVHPSLELRVHSADVHRILNDLEIAKTTIS